MEKFIMKKSNEANIYKSIRFPVEINDSITEIVRLLIKIRAKKSIALMDL